jgi:hypothetical protein
MSPEFAFHFGLDRILDGIADLIASKKRTSEESINDR